MLKESAGTYDRWKSSQRPCVLLVRKRRVKYGKEVWKYHSSGSCRA